MSDDGGDGEDDGSDGAGGFGDGAVETVGPGDTDGGGTFPGDSASEEDEGDDPFTSEDVGLALRGRILLEYVTFGYGVHHLLRVVVFQFAVLFLDVGLFGFAGNRVPAGRRLFATAMWLLATVVFFAILVALVKRMGRRTLGPRFHRPLHLAASVCGYVIASGITFLFGYLTVVLPTAAGREASSADLLPSMLVVLVFATFIAIGYHRQVDATDHPRAGQISQAIHGWLDALSWIEHEPNSLGRERTYEEFQRRTDEVSALLADARTVEGRQLAEEFHAWRDRFEAHSMLSQERVVRGSGDDGPLESDRLDAEHERFVSLRERLAAVAGATDD